MKLRIDLNGHPNDQKGFDVIADDGTRLGVLGAGCVTNMRLHIDAGKPPRLEVSFVVSMESGIAETSDKPDAYYLSLPGK